MHGSIAKVSIADLFTEARTHHAWEQRDVSDELLNELFDLAKWGPTSLNSLPARFPVRQVEGRQGEAYSSTGGVQCTSGRSGAGYGRRRLRREVL